MNPSRGHRCKQAENQEKWPRPTNESRPKHSPSTGRVIWVPSVNANPTKNISPLSKSHSGDEAPLHSLRGPRIGDIRLKSDKETVLGRSRLQGREDGVGEVEEEEEEEKGQGRSTGLLGPELKLLLD